jgi:hypothetical protein
MCWEERNIYQEMRMSVSLRKMYEFRITDKNKGSPLERRISTPLCLDRDHDRP